MASPITDTASLRAAVRSWINRTPAPTDAEIDQAILQAETLLNETLRSRHNRTSTTFNIGYNNVFGLTIPNDYLELLDATVDGTWRLDDTNTLVEEGTPGPSLQPVPYRTFVNLFPAPGYRSGAPFYYTELPDGAAWQFSPSAKGYRVRMWYYARLASMLDNTVNRLLTAEPSAYLSGVMSYLETFYRIPQERRGPWGQMFSGVVNSLNESMRKSLLSGGSMRARNPYGNW